MCIAFHFLISLLSGSFSPIDFVILVTSLLSHSSAISFFILNVFTSVVLIGFPCLLLIYLIFIYLRLVYNCHSLHSPDSPLTDQPPLSALLSLHTFFPNLFHESTFHLFTFIHFSSLSLLTLPRIFLAIIYPYTIFTLICSCKLLIYFVRRLDCSYQCTERKSRFQHGKSSCYIT